MEKHLPLHFFPYESSYQLLELVAALLRYDVPGIFGL